MQILHASTETSQLIKDADRCLRSNESLLMDRYILNVYKSDYFYFWQHKIKLYEFVLNIYRSRN